METSENIPPAKKLKQATLNFFKASPKVKSTTPSVPIQNLKRKHPSGPPDSPNKKTAKLSKPLAPALSNADKSPQTNQVSTNKQTKSDIVENDQEVSSSSEAETKEGKAAGKSCLLERFVKKLPPGIQEEISSTNEVLDVSVEFERKEDADELEGKDDTDELERKEDTDECKNKTECIIIDDDSCEQSLKDKNTNDIEKVTSDKAKDSVIKSNLDDKNNAEPAMIKKEQANVTEQVSTPKKVKLSNDSEMISPIISTPAHVKIGTPKDSSTPKNQQTIEGSGAETPNTTKRKPGRKIDSAKKAERDAIKQKLKEDKEREKAEKKQKLEEEKQKKEQERRELKEAKEKEKQILKEKVEKEKAEKQKAKEEEKKKKEEERLQKEEEKRKINEAKEEEKRKKEEEKKQKDDEKKAKEEERLKEEEEKRLKAEKAKQAFQSFFIKGKEQEPKQQLASMSNDALSFIPFQLKKDMHLAVVRPAIQGPRREELDQALAAGATVPKDSLYLEHLRRGDVKPHKTMRILRKNPQPVEEVEIIHDASTLQKVTHKMKLLQFHTDYRPPYYGTGRKTTSLNPRNPWFKDGATDYEFDSEEEWEEEEPGESLSNSEGEQENLEEDVDEEDGDGFMVPHGYLSEDEGCNEDDEISPEKLKLQQALKAKAWEEEQKKKLKVAPVLQVGCFFENGPSPLMAGDVRLLYQFRGVVLTPCVPIPTEAVCRSEADDKATDADGGSPVIKKRGVSKMDVPDGAMADLIKLVHGNTVGIKRLIKEFRVFWLRTQDNNNGNDILSSSMVAAEDTSVLNDSTIDSTPSNPDDKLSPEKPNEILQNKKEEGYGCSISKRQLEKKIMSIAVRDKRPGFNKACWYVHQEILSQFGQADLSLPNTWVFLSAGPVRSPAPNMNKGLNMSKSEAMEVEEEDKEDKDKKQAKSTDQKSIMAFTMTKEELLKQESLKPKPVVSKVDSVTTELENNSTPLKVNKKSAFTEVKQNSNSSCQSNILKKNTPKTPSSDKKPKTSIMDMFKKSSAKKLKTSSSEDVQPSVISSADSDITIVEVLKPSQPASQQESAMDTDDKEQDKNIPIKDVALLVDDKMDTSPIPLSNLSVPNVKDDLNVIPTSSKKNSVNQSDDVIVLD